ncbi:MAG: RIO1 family regulatory kinase/ATPase [Candidatus Bathyarchaeia archaeon]
MSFKSRMHRFRELTPRDFRILLAVEAGMERHKFVPASTVFEYSNIPPSEAEHRLNGILRLRLLTRTSAPYEGYSLNYAGYDFLALNAFVKADILESLGQSIGVGKEADVYEAILASQRRAALKFHRLGRISFRQTKKVRPYGGAESTWLFKSRRAASREFEALGMLHKSGLPVPEPIMHNRHAVLMGEIIGIQASQLKRLPTPRRYLIEILSIIRRAYCEAGVVHGDLSEFNILIQPDGKVLIIDWPQYVNRDHPSAERLLRRDIANVVESFRRRYGVRMDLRKAEEFVSGLRSELN